MGMVFSNKSVIVTGAASGIGRAAAIRFAQEGANVCLADINIEGARHVARGIGSRAIAIETDITDSASYAHCITGAMKKFGALDVAFLNAGYLGPMEGIEATDEELFDRLITINLKGAFLGIKALMNVISDGGSIVVTASTAGVIGLAESPAYSAAKHGVLGLVKSCAPTMANRGARINAICPGAVNTPMLGESDETVIEPKNLSRVPLRGKGSAQHVAEVALWLASPASGFVNGQAHIVDAGLLSTFVPSPEGP